MTLLRALFLTISCAGLLAQAQASLLLSSNPYKYDVIQYPETSVKNYCPELDIVSDYVYDKHFTRSNKVKRRLAWEQVKTICNSLYKDSVVECDKQKVECDPIWHRLPAKINNKDKNCHFKLIHYCTMSVAVHADPGNIPSLGESNRKSINSCIGGNVNIRKRSISRQSGQEDMIIFDSSNNDYAPVVKDAFRTEINPANPIYIAAIGRSLDKAGHDSVLRCKNGKCSLFSSCMALNFNTLGLGGNMPIGVSNPIIPYPYGLWATDDADLSYKNRIDIENVATSWNQELTLACRVPVHYLFPNSNKESTRIECAVTVTNNPRDPDTSVSIYRVELEINGGFDDVTAACSRISENSPSDFMFCIEGFEAFVNIASFMLSFGSFPPSSPVFASPTVGPPIKLSTVRSIVPFAGLLKHF